MPTEQLYLLMVQEGDVSMNGIPAEDESTPSFIRMATLFSQQIPLDANRPL